MLLLLRGQLVCGSGSQLEQGLGQRLQYCGGAVDVAPDREHQHIVLVRAYDRPADICEPHHSNACRGVLLLSSNAVPALLCDWLFFRVVVISTVLTQFDRLPERSEPDARAWDLLSIFVLLYARWIRANEADLLVVLDRHVVPPIITLGHRVHVRLDVDAGLEHLADLDD
jgi:hypothetical protein